MTGSAPFDWQLHEELLRRCAPALRADRHQHPFPCSPRSTTWFSQGDRTAAARADQPHLVLADLRRLQRRLLPDAHSRHARHATPDLYVCGRTGLGQLEHGDHRGRTALCTGRAGHHRQPALQLAARRSGRAQSVARVDARMVDSLAAAAVQLRPHSFPCHAGTALGERQRPATDGTRCGPHTRARARSVDHHVPRRASHRPAGDARRFAGTVLPGCGAAGAR